MNEHDYKKLKQKTLLAISKHVAVDLKVTGKFVFVRTWQGWSKAHVSAGP